MANSVSIRVGAPGAKQASSEIDNLRDRFAKLQAQGAKGFAIGAGAAITAKALGLVGSAIGDVTGFLVGSVHAYQEQEVASGRLTQSLQANVKGWDGNTDAIKRATEAGVQLGFTDTDTTNSMAILIGATHDQAKALRILAVAQDLARFKGLSLVEASTALTTIEAGRARGLAQLGINVKDYSTTEERLAAVEKLAGGQAQQFAESDMGKVQVEVAKADQAQEKFGKGLSKLEAVVLPAVGDAIGGLGDAIGTLTDSFDSAVPRSEKLREEADALRHGWINAGPGAKQMADDLTKQADAMDAADAAAKALTGSMDDERRAAQANADAATAKAAQAVGEAYGNLNSKLIVTGPLLSHLADYAKEADRKVAQLNDDTHSLASTIEDELFGKAINAGNEARLKQNIIDLEKQRKEVKKGSPDWIELTGQIAENQKALFDLHLEEAAAKGPKAAIAFLESEKAHAKGTTAELDKLIAKYRALAALQGTLGPIILGGGGSGLGGVRDTNRASGGLITSGMQGWVGEEGPERYKAEGGVVKIFPTPKVSAPKLAPLPSAPAGTVGNSAFGLAQAELHVHFHLPNAYGMTPGQADALGRAIAPYISRAQQRSGHLAPARAF